MTRYQKIVFLAVPPVVSLPSPTTGTLGALQISVKSADTTLGYETSENYTLSIPAGANAVGLLTADTVYGALRGLERFSQLVDWNTGTQYFVPVIQIVDSPRFAHRGALIDSARHYLSMNSILAFVDALAYNFMNVLHWHIVDDQSFPYVSTTYPALSGNGSWNAPRTTHIYTQDNVATVIAYAQARGVRVIPEFDTPGHTTSWGLGQPGLLTQCYDANGQPIPGDFGPIDPTNPQTWTFLQNFFQEIAEVYPDSFMHLGGDEVQFDCWASNPAIQQWMQQQGFGNNYELLENYYEQKLVDLVRGLNKSYVVWQDVFDNGVNISPDTVVHAWKGGSAAAGYAEMQKITKAGYRTILSAGWYENYIAYGPTWETYYQTEPQNFTGTAEQKALVMGGEFAMWGEYVDDTNFLARCWPFGSAVAERLWSPKDTTDIDDAADRLHVHRCRMVNRGLQVQPANGPSFCPQEWQTVYLPPF